jgi:hypothetical protein
VEDRKLFQIIVEEVTPLQSNRMHDSTFVSTIRIKLPIAFLSIKIIPEHLGIIAPMLAVRLSQSP